MHSDDEANLRDDFEKVSADYAVALLIGWDPEVVQRARHEQERATAEARRGWWRLW